MSYKRIEVKASETASPQTTFIEENATVGDILEQLGISANKSTVYVDGDEVDANYIPDNEDTLILAPKKYASGAMWWPR